MKRFIKPTLEKITCSSKDVLFFSDETNGLTTEKEQKDVKSGLIFTPINEGTEYKVSGILNRFGREIIIPTTYNGKKVVGVGNNAFFGCTFIEKIVIGENVKEIGGGAFNGCALLKEIEVSGNVVSIGCDAFTNTAWWNANPDGLVYLGDTLLGYKGNASSCVRAVIGEKCKYVADSAFRNCDKLTDVTFSNGVIGIGYDVFYGCSSLKNVILPDSVESIGFSAFYGCTKLSSVVLGKGLKRIGNFAFYGCSAVKEIRFIDSAGWFITENSKYVDGKSIKVNNVNLNATYFVSTYYDYYWYKK